MSDTPRRYGLMRDASYLLPDPGGEVVRGLLADLAAMTAERDAATLAALRMVRCFLVLNNVHESLDYPINWIDRQIAKEEAAR